MKDIREWILFVITIGISLVTASVTWTKLIAKVNGLGARTKKVEDSCSASSGRMASMEREIADTKRDAADANKQLGRVEKSLDELRNAIQDGNIALGVQLTELTKVINERNTANQIRFTRIETVSDIEKKLGHPIPIS